MYFTALSKKKRQGGETSHARTFLMEPIGQWKGKPRPRTTRGKSSHFKLTISFFVGFSPPSVCHIFMSFPAVTDCFHSSPIQLLGTEAFVLSYPFAPKQRSPSWIPTRRSHFPPPVLTPQHSDYGAYKHSIASSAPPFSLTFQNLLLKRGAINWLWSP